ERFKRVLETTLSLPPSDQTAALYDTILMRSRTRPRASAPLVSSSNPRTAGPPAAAPPRDPRLSLAVLPLRNLSGGMEHDHVVEGITEDLVEALSRIPSLFVVSRRSAAAFGNQDRPLSEIAEALGVRHLIAGSVRVAAGRLRLSAELTDTVLQQPLGII